MLPFGPHLLLDHRMTIDLNFKYDDLNDNCNCNKTINNF